MLNFRRDKTWKVRQGLNNKNMLSWILCVNDNDNKFTPTCLCKVNYVHTNESQNCRMGMRETLQTSTATLQLYHLEIFEHIRGFDVTIVTSAKQQDETFILWSGFFPDATSYFSY